MLEVIALLAVLVGIVSFLIHIMLRWGSFRLTGEIESRMRAAESIVNRDQLPDEWLKPYRKRIAALRERGKDQDEIEQVGRTALAGSLRQIDGLIKFFESSSLVDSAESRETLLGSLREKKMRWAAASWQSVLD